MTKPILGLKQSEARREGWKTKKADEIPLTQQCHFTNERRSSSDSLRAAEQEEESGASVRASPILECFPSLAAAAGVLIARGEKRSGCPAQQC